MFSVLILSIFILSACNYLQVKPGKAIAVGGRSGQLLCLTAGDRGCTYNPEAVQSCCVGLSCVNDVCVSPVPANCTASTICYTGNYLNVTTSNCTKSTTSCQYGCSVGSGVCNGAPSNCTPTTFCAGNYLNTTTANCTKTSTFCQYGCSGGQCNGAPSNCTISTSCSGSYLNTTASNCSVGLTFCQYGCNSTIGQCNQQAQNCTYTPNFCTDGDSGLNPLIVSTMIWADVNAGCNKRFIDTDLCLTNTTVRETDCSLLNSVFPPETVLTCPTNTTCAYGRCQPFGNITCTTTCADNDNGNNIYVAGGVSGMNCSGPSIQGLNTPSYSYYDYCVGGSTIVEYTCSGAVAVGTSQSCPAGTNCVNIGGVTSRCQ